MSDSRDIAKQVYDQLADDFPKPTVEWVLDKDIKWEGPIAVDISQVDFDNVHRWSAWNDDDKVNRFEKKIKKGKLKPVVLVRRPHKSKLIVVDGHHRSLASKRIGASVLAYVAHVKDVIGPWDTMHDSQNRLRTAADKGDLSPSDLRTAAVCVIDDGHGNVLTTTRDGKEDDLDLPGGRLEPNETAEQAARRETLEETGVTVGALTQLYAGSGSDNRRHVTIYRALESDALKVEAATNGKFKPEKGQTIRWMKPKDLTSDDCTFGEFTKDHFNVLFGHLPKKHDVVSASDRIPTDATIAVSPAWLEEFRRGLDRRNATSVTADIGPSSVHSDGLSGGYRLETAAERNPKFPNTAAFQQPLPPKREDIPRWPLSQNVKRIRMPIDKFALPDQNKYPIDTAARTRSAAARLEQNKARLSPTEYSKAKAAIGRAAKKFGIHYESAGETPRATDHLVPHMHVEATIPHGGNLHVRHLSDSKTQILSLYDANGAGDYREVVVLADAPEDGPVWNQVACVGAFKGHPAGPFELNAKVFDEIVSNWERTGRKPIPVDYEHASEAEATSGTIPISGAPAQGWITDLKNNGAAGLFGKFEWLPLARSQIRGGQYKFLSPAIRFESRDKISGRPIGARLTSAALTNQPFLDNLAPVKAKAMAKDLIAATDVAVVGAATANDGSVLVTMQGIAESDHFITPSREYMPKLKACMGLHPLASHDEMKDHLDRLREHVSKAGGNLSTMVDGVSLAAFVHPLRELAMGSGGASTTIDQVFHAVEAMIDAAMQEHVAIEHTMDDVAMAGYADATSMATAIESDKGATSMATAIESDKGSAPLAGYSDASMAGYKDAAANMADKVGEQDMEKLAEKDAEITRLQLQLSEQQSEVTKFKTENTALAAWKKDREEKDLENEIDFVLSAHADKIANLPGDDTSKRTLLLKALKESPDFFHAQYPKSADPSKQYLLSTQTPPAQAPSQPMPELDAILVHGEDLRATTARLRDEKKLSYIDAAQQAMRLHQIARQMAG